MWSPFTAPETAESFMNWPLTEGKRAVQHGCTSFENTADNDFIFKVWEGGAASHADTSAPTQVSREPSYLMKGFGGVKLPARLRPWELSPPFTLQPRPTARPPHSPTHQHPDAKPSSASPASTVDNLKT